MGLGLGPATQDVVCEDDVLPVRFPNLVDQITDVQRGLEVWELELPKCEVRCGAAVMVSRAVVCETWREKHPYASRHAGQFLLGKECCFAFANMDTSIAACQRVDYNSDRTNRPMSLLVQACLGPALSSICYVTARHVRPVH
ncbi:hypothetical protein HaLaN_17002 [Haematococcus lacustris]|uniref:Uncharacterized protein n=1 Tax=Haematococcus lacustris TaxID=44745 RepID=A0A699ZVJ5_HAELA|nr:hypothetical protein HaLaN_17002 [Haematococcus lacustris]